MKVVTEFGNLFLATGHDFAALDTCYVMKNVVAISKITEVGKTLHLEYVDTRLTNDTVPVPHTIKRNRLFRFSNCPDTLIAQRFISLQSRPEADIVDLFKDENQREPLLYRTVVFLEREIS